MDKLIENVVRVLRGHDYIRGIALTGSRGNDDKSIVDRYSDADFIICCKNENFNEFMKGNWIERIKPSILIFPMIMKNEIRVLYEGFMNCDFHIYNYKELNELTGECKLGDYISCGFRILYDPDSILEKLAENINPCEHEVEENEFEIVSGVFWHNVFYCACLIMRGDLHRAYFMSNKYLQEYLLSMIYDTDSPDSDKCLEKKISTDCYEKIVRCYSALTRKDMIQGLKNCMDCYWYFQKKVNPGYDENKLRSFKMIENEIIRMFGEVSS